MKASLTIRVLILCLMGAVVIWSVFPFAWYFLVSLTSPGHIPRSFQFPDVLTLDSYGAALFGGNYAKAGAKFSVVPNIINSFVVALMTVAMCTVLSFGAAYVFSRLRTPMLDLSFNALLLIRMTPAVTLAVPLYLMMSNYQLIDTYFGLSLIHTLLSLPLAIWLLKGYLDAIPMELEEAAYMDGAGLFTMWFYVVIPLAAPGIAVTAFFIFLSSYIEFMFALIMSSGTIDTLPLAIASYNSEHQTFYNEMAAASFISMVPLAAFFFIAGRYIVGGLTTGAVKS